MEIFMRENLEMILWMAEAYYHYYYLIIYSKNNKLIYSIKL